MYVALKPGYAPSAEDARLKRGHSVATCTAATPITKPHASAGRATLALRPGQSADDDGGRLADDSRGRRARFAGMDIRR
jgi:hypothetical protein